MNNTMNSTLQKIPGIGDIPILGLLFKSKAAQKNQTELVVMITPQILPSELARRDAEPAAHAGAVLPPTAAEQDARDAAAGVHAVRRRPPPRRRRCTSRRCPSRPATRTPASAADDDARR